MLYLRGAQLRMHHEEQWNTNAECRSKPVWDRYGPEGISHQDTVSRAEGGERGAVRGTGGQTALGRDEQESWSGVRNALVKPERPKARER